MWNAIRNMRCLKVGTLLGAMLCLAPSLLAQVNLQINNPPSNNVLDGIYVGSYSATNTGTGAQTQIICDDFKDNSNYNKYSYNVSAFGNFNNTLWGAGAANLYQEAAWLTLGMLNQSGTQQGYYSYAIWAIFAPSQVASWLTSYGDSGACNAVFGGGSWGSGKCTAGGGGLLASASGQQYYSGEFSNFLILTPQGCGSAGFCQEQEFFQLVPEGGSAAMYLLLAGTSCFAAMFYSRRQTAKRNVA